MCGGQGTKLWPISRQKNPKQFSKMLGDKSLFQSNVEQLATKYEYKDIYVSTSSEYIDYIKEQAPKIPKENYIIEPPLRKATGPACCFALAKMMIDFPNEVVMFYVQPVVLRTPTEKYLEMIDALEKLVKENKLLATGGMYPKYPESGSDYLELGDQLSADNNLEVYKTKRFVYRPTTLKEAKELLSNYKLSLHCNHNTWIPSEFFNELKEYKKDWYDLSMELVEALKRQSSEEEINEIYGRFEKGNVEVFTQQLHNAGKVQVAILPFEWRHITTWNDIYEYYAQHNKELEEGKVVSIESTKNLIINKTDTVIGTIGIEDLTIVQTKDAILICKRDDTGKIPLLLKEIDSHLH